jgi:hypothetical protein
LSCILPWQDPFVVQLHATYARLPKATNIVTPSGHDWMVGPKISLLCRTVTQDDPGINFWSERLR